MNYKAIVERNVSIPAPQSFRNTGGIKYPELLELEPGDCLAIPLDEKVYFHRLAASCSNYSKKYDRRFTTRVMADKYRIWRIK